MFKKQRTSFDIDCSFIGKFKKLNTHKIYIYFFNNRILPFFLLFNHTFSSLLWQYSSSNQIIAILTKMLSKVKTIIFVTFRCIKKIVFQ